jgi:hypothetical protein
MNKISLAIIGCGARGDGVYAHLAHDVYADRVKVVAIADINPERLELTRRLCDVDPALITWSCAMCFATTLFMALSRRMIGSGKPGRPWSMRRPRRMSVIGIWPILLSGVIGANAEWFPRR